MYRIDTNSGVPWHALSVDLILNNIYSVQGTLTFIYSHGGLTDKSDRRLSMSTCTIPPDDANNAIKVCRAPDERIFKNVGPYILRDVLDNLKSHTRETDLL